MSDTASGACGKRVLLAGATTPLGRAITQQLLDAGADRVVAIGAPHEGAPDLPRDARVVVLEADLSRSRERRRLLFGPAREHGVEVLIWAATHRSPQATGKRAHALNVHAVREVLHLAERHPTLRAFILKSTARVYRVTPGHTTVMDETHPLDLASGGPQWLRDRVEADVTATMQVARSGLRVVVLRCAECLAEGTGSQLWDYLRSRVCFRPLGYDPMLNLASVADLARAFTLAACSDARGALNIPGADTLPLSQVIARFGRREVLAPGFLLTPLYRVRNAVLGTDFRYDLNRSRFHESGLLDGARAEATLGYIPEHTITWPTPSA